MIMLRRAIRSLRRAPRLTLAAVLCFGLGAAATASVATLVGAALLRPLPFPSADRLARIWLAEADGNPRVSLSIPEIVDFSHASAFEPLLGTARVRVVAQLDRGAERMRGEAVSRGYFQTLGLRPAIGRVLSDSDATPDAARVIVLSHRTWVVRYGADPDVIGRTFRTERAAYTIVGVAPAGFSGTVEDDVVEFWIPLGQYEPAALLEDRVERTAWAIGRLRAGASFASAQAELDALWPPLRDAHPDLYRRLSPRIEPMGENWRASLRGSGAVLSAAALLLLIVAAINLAGLLFARVLARQRELAVCAAIGASRRQLVVQLLTEALMIVGAGSLLGAIAGPFVLDAFLALSPIALPTYLQLEPDATTLAVSIVVLGIVGVLAGCAPAFAGSRVDAGDALKSNARGAIGLQGERRWGDLVVAGEAAMTIILLVSGGLLLRSYARLERTDVGYRVDGVARLAVTLTRQDAADGPAVLALYDRLRGAIGSYPGVEQVGLVWPTLPP